MKVILRFLLVLFSVLGLALGAGSEPPVVAKIIIKQDGIVLFDGHQVQIGELDALLTPIKEKKGVVWYYRANPKSEPPPEAMEVLKAIVAKRVPIKLFSKEDFSEWIDADGKPHHEKNA